MRSWPCAAILNPGVAPVNNFVRSHAANYEGGLMHVDEVTRIGFKTGSKRRAADTNQPARDSFRFDQAVLKLLLSSLASSAAKARCKTYWPARRWHRDPIVIGSPVRYKKRNPSRSRSTLYKARVRVLVERPG